MILYNYEKSVNNVNGKGMLNVKPQTSIGILKMLILTMFFLTLLFSSLTIISAYARSAPAYTFGYQTKDYTGTGQLLPTFNREMCGAGQDFIVQIDPLGCTPSIVRSDLLEEQEVSVLCPVYATQLNPLIKIENINYMTISSRNLPQEVIHVGYYPARAALGKWEQNLATPVFDNIGYAQIVLRRQPNESAMPDFVEGNLTANIRYDIQNAFGTGRVNYYLPQLSDADWNRDYTAYGFWDGRGYLRLESSDDNGAVIGVYSDRDFSGSGRSGEKSRITTLNLEKGGKPEEVFMPGFNYCLGGVEVKLNALETPDTRVRLQVDESSFEIKKGEKFLENKCVIKEAVRQGINQKVKISCSEDERKNDFSLFITPKVNLSVGEDIREVEVGEKLYEEEDEKGRHSVYLGFIGNDNVAENPEGLYVRLIKLPFNEGGNQPFLGEDDLNYVFNYDTKVSPAEVRGGVGVGEAALQQFTRIITAGREVYRRVINGETTKRLDFGRGEVIFGTNVEVLDYAGAYDTSLEALPEEAKEVVENYENAIDDYKTVIDDFASDRYPENDVITSGEQALYNSITLSAHLGQRRTALELCQDFEANYDSVAPSICKETYLLSNRDTATQSVLINGKTHILSFGGIRDPSFEEFGLKINIRYPDGEIKSEFLSKNEIYYIRDEVIYSYKTSITSASFYYKFDERWQWSRDQINWMNTNTFTVQGGFYNGKDAEEGQQPVIEYLNDQSTNEEIGITYLLELGAKAKINDEYIQLVDLSPDSATLKTNLFKTTLTGQIGNNVLNQKLGIEEEKNFDSRYFFTIEKINLEKVAKVSLNPKIDYARTNASFNFRIGIEKRNIQLSPEKTAEKIRSLNETLEKWTKISDSLGKVVQTGKTACAVTAGALTIKNFFSNLGGKGIARQKAMRSEGGWYDICQKAVNTQTQINGKGPFGDVEACLLSNSDAIEKTVNAYEEGQNQINKKMDELQECKTKFLGETICDTDALTTSYLEDSQFKSEISSCKTGTLKIAGEDVSISTITSRINENTTSLTQARDLQLNCRLINSEDANTAEIARSQAEKIMGEIYSNSKLDSQIKDFASKAGVDSGKTNFVALTDSKPEPYLGLTYANIKNKITIPDITDETPVATILTSTGREYYAVLSKSGDNYAIVENGLYDLNGKPSPERLNVYFKTYDSSTYENRYENPTVRYYETDPYRGLPAVVPFDIQKGWYAAVKSNVPLLGGLKGYDDSGRVSSFYVCNVGQNKREEFISGDDDCRGFVPGANQPPDFGILSPSESLALMNRAVRAIQDATNAHSTGVKKITLSSVSCIRAPCTIDVGEPAADIPDIQCEDFMSPTDCNIMFNVCDPFVCPSSRCDLGGNYPVKDVVQSGIAGSLFLCLPNFPEVKVPICVSGVHAGVEGWLSVLESYQQCLQTSLDSGSTVGICDEVNSVYMCDFFWRQGLPVVKYYAPKVLSSVLGQNTRGGGEYLGAQSAIDNVGKSFDYFTQYYADDSFRAFKARSAEGVGTEICKNWVSIAGPEGGNLFDALTAPDSPTQFYGRFEEIPYTTATNPPASQYKVFYHIYAGKDLPAYYQVYLRGTGSSFYQDTNFPRPVASGFIPTGDFKTETIDFTAPSGYKELCIVVNGQEQCGFKQVTTEFGINYLTEQYVADEASRTDINSEKECVSGSPNTFSLVSPNVQGGAEEFANPAIYNRGIIRVCSTNNPGQSTDSKINTQNSRWKDVGHCGDENLRCWLDSSSVKDVIRDAETEKQILGEIEENLLEKLKKEGDYIDDFDSFTKSLDELESQGKDAEIIDTINKNISKVFLSNQIAYLHLRRGISYGTLAFIGYDVFLQTLKTDTPPTIPGTGEDFISPDPDTVQEISNIEKIFHYEDGIAFSEDLYYSFSGDEWYWSDKRNSGWVSVNGIPYLSSQDLDTSGQDVTSVELIGDKYNRLSDEPKAMIGALKDKNYVNGLTQLLHRAGLNDGGTWYDLKRPSKLSTDDVEFTGDKIFTLKNQNVVLRNLETQETYSRTVDTIYFDFFVNNQWRWSIDKKNWRALNEYSTVSASFTVTIVDESFKNFLESIRGEEYFVGAALIFGEQGAGTTGTGTSGDIVPGLDTTNPLVREAVEELEKWDNGGLAECDEETRALLIEYWGEYGSTSFSCGDDAWSAVFTSYVARQSGLTNFPDTGSHAQNFAFIRDNPGDSGCSTYDRSKFDQIKVGDILFSCRIDQNNGGTCPVSYSSVGQGVYGHSMVVVGKDSDYVYTIGGNEADSVRLQKRPIREELLVSNIKDNKYYYGFVSCNQ